MELWDNDKKKQFVCKIIWIFSKHHKYIHHDSNFEEKYRLIKNGKKPQ